MSEEITKNLPKGLLQWYDFKQNSHVLYIGDRQDAYLELLKDLTLDVEFVPLKQDCGMEWLQLHRENFDCLVSVAALEQAENPAETLSLWRSLLKPDGRMLLGMNNRLGLKYFCGDRDPYTGRNFDGIEGYREAYVKKEDDFAGRCYSHKELECMLKSAGFGTFRFFSVLPDLQNPCLIYAEDCLPNEDLSNRLFPTYNYPDTVFLEEEGLYAALAENGMFHQMANAFLIECSMDGKLCDVLHVTASMERGKTKALFTVLHRDGMVEKKAAWPEGVRCLEELDANLKDLKRHGVSVVETKMENGACIMPLLKAETGQVYLKRLLETDAALFLQEMDRFRDLILKSSEIVKPDSEDGEGAILRRGYLDMVPLNSFYTDGSFVFFDQEFCMESCPANLILSRMVNTFYAGNAHLQKYMAKEALYDRYGLAGKSEHWQEMEYKFLSELRKEKELCAFHQKHRRDTEILNANRRRMNYSESEYQRLFIDIFECLDEKKLVLFGSGRYAERFLEMYGEDYPVSLAVDNSNSRWGKEIGEVKIQSPDVLKGMDSRKTKVIICMKNYLSVARQLEGMGITEYGIFDPGRAYPRKWKSAAPAVQKPSPEIEMKKYHTGYIAGVFDLFHVGHLNMFRRAKEQCDYLIVGIVSDEGVKQYKKVEPFIPFEERIEMVRSCRYVDEAVKIPLTCRGTRDAYRLYQFDVQFSGSDYADDPGWLADQAFLRKHGAEMVFFPYTQATSSSKIKELIEKKLL